MLNSKVYDSIAGNIVNGKNPAEYLKAIKNDTEIKNQLEAHKIDCVALTKYFRYLKTNVGKININEYTAQEKLHEFRAESPLFIEESFGTISAYGPNAAMMHYSANENKHSDLKPKSILVISTGLFAFILYTSFLLSAITYRYPFFIKLAVILNG